MELANSIITLQPGLYILRHPRTGLPPISISRAAGRPSHDGRLESLHTAGTDGGILRDGSDCIVMQVLAAPVDLLVTAYLDSAAATVPTLRVDKIALEAKAAAVQPAGSLAVAPAGITLVGYVERCGDASAAPGTTLGDPDSGLRIEGFQVVWPDKPAGVELACSARFEDTGNTPAVPTGRYCGTRNAGRRIVGATFLLTGPQAPAFRLQGRAFFSGGFSAELASGHPASGPSGCEHLTGLRLDVQPAVAVVAAATGMPSSRPRPASARAGRSRKRA